MHRALRGHRKAAEEDRWEPIAEVRCAAARAAFRKGRREAIATAGLDREAGWEHRGDRGMDRRRVGRPRARGAA